VRVRGYPPKIVTNLFLLSANAAVESQPPTPSVLGACRVGGRMDRGRPWRSRLSAPPSLQRKDWTRAVRLNTLARRSGTAPFS